MDLGLNESADVFLSVSLLLILVLEPDFKIYFHQNKGLIINMLQTW